MSGDGKVKLSVLERLHNCETCRMRAYAERKPQKLVSRIWRWHTKWCPLLKAHERRSATEEPTDEPAE